MVARSCTATILIVYIHKRQIIYLFKCSAPARHYHRAAQKTLSQRVICPQVNRENNNRISLRIHPRGHRIQSSRTNEHQRRLKEICLTGQSLTHFLNLQIKTVYLVWVRNYVASCVHTIKSAVTRRSVVTQRRAAYYSGWSQKIIKVDFEADWILQEEKWFILVCELN